MLLTEEQYRALGYVGKARETRRRALLALAWVDESLARSCARAADAGVPLRRIGAVAEHERVRKLAIRGRELLAADAVAAAARPVRVVADRYGDSPGARGRRRSGKRSKR